MGKSLQEKVFAKPDLRDYYIPFKSTGLNQQVLGDIAKYGGFLKEFDTEEKVRRYKDSILHDQFSEILGEENSPFIPTEKNQAIFNTQAKPYKIEDTDTPEQKAFKEVGNRLIKFKGGLPEPDFMRRVIGGTMTNGWAKFLTGTDVSSLFEDFEINDDGVTFQGEKLNVDADKLKTLSDFVLRTSGQDAEIPFWEKVAQTTLSLSFDLPLMFATGAVAGVAMKASGTVLPALMESTEFFPRLIGHAKQQKLK